jgi:hypothetical protein
MISFLAATRNLDHPTSLFSIRIFNQREHNTRIWLSQLESRPGHSVLE